MGCDRCRRRSRYFSFCFNPRTRVGCDAKNVCLILSKALFQSTHPCGVRLYHQVTRTSSSRFQSTHPCGVRLYKNSRHSKRMSFNPRTRVGCNNLTSVKIVSFEFQSTHPCGVRLASVCLTCNPTSFNPRTRVGCDYQENCY